MKRSYGSESSGTTRFVRPQDGRITPELINAIADRVYAMLSLELRVERERNRLAPRRGRRGRS